MGLCGQVVGRNVWSPDGELSLDVYTNGPQEDMFSAGSLFSDFDYSQTLRQLRFNDFKKTPSFKSITSQLDEEGYLPEGQMIVFKKEGVIQDVALNMEYLLCMIEWAQDTLYYEEHGEELWEKEDWFVVCPGDYNDCALYTGENPEIPEDRRLEIASWFSESGYVVPLHRRWSGSENSLYCLNNE